jgi:predicted enzyme related to lactoylglutathione lyase
MTLPVTCRELNTADLEATTAFFADVFGRQLQPFAAPDYLVAPHGDGAGIDTVRAPRVRRGVVHRRSSAAATWRWPSVS